MSPDFKRLLTVRFVFTIATQMQAIMLGWRMYELTHDPLHLGLIGLAEAIPALGLALYAGFLVDRSHPLRVMRRVLDVSVVSAVLFLVSQHPQLHLDTSSQVVTLYACSFVTGLVRAFTQPSIYATVPRLVSRSLLAKASAFMASSMQVARVAGPALGGLLFGWLGLEFTTTIVCVLLVVGAVLVRRMALFDMLERSPSTGSQWVELLAGARFVFRHPILLPALSLDMLSVLFGGVTALLPIYASEILSIGPRGLGMLRAAPAVGAAVMSLFLMRVTFGPRSGLYLLMSVAGFGLCIITFGMSKTFGTALTMLALSGAFDSVSMVIRSAAVQLESPAALRGRIAAVNSIFIGSSNELGEFESGVAARLFGPIPTVLGGGVICLLVVSVVALASKSLRRLDLGTSPA